MDLLLYETGARGIWKTAEERNIALLSSLFLSPSFSPATSFFWV